MAVQGDHGTERPEASDGLLQMLWLGVGLVAFVAFSYWLTAF